MQFPNLFISNSAQSMQYKTGRMSVPQSYITRRAREHGDNLRTQFEATWATASAETRTIGVQDSQGVYIEIYSAPEFDLKLSSLENMKNGIRLLNFSQSDDEEKIQRATVFIPNDQRHYFLKKIEKYIETSDNASIRNKGLFNNIESIQRAVANSFWIGRQEDIPSEIPVWCEVWLRCDEAENNIEIVHNKFAQLCNEYSISYSTHFLHFPERIVFAVKASFSDLSLLILSLPFIAEFRRGLESNLVILDSSYPEQKGWSEDLVSRTQFVDNPNVSVCILDTGVNRENPLLKPFIRDDGLHTVLDAWGKTDLNGHGTNMAGVVAYDDMMHLLMTTDTYHVNHQIESVKIMPDSGNNPEELFGYVTAQAVSIATIAAPDLNRIICMAITAPSQLMDGRPSSWSGSIDELSYGDGDNKTLFILSAGNVQLSDLNAAQFPDANYLKPIEDPAQSWNAITVGAYTEKIMIDDLPDESTICVEPGDISPFTSSSTLWNKNSWPNKPDIVCEGGNAIRLIDRTHSDYPDLSVLTANSKINRGIFDCFNGTSPATAQAAWIAANIQANYPELWPETVRALMIHSAEWTPAMKSRFISVESKNEYAHMMQFCGYGVPNLERAIYSMENAVNIVLQDTIQPYEIEEGKSTPKIKDMNVYELPWPEELLLSIHDSPVTVRITLSYFIEPGLGEIGWKDRYRYPSCALRFDLNNTDEDRINFMRRINAAARDEESGNGDGSSGSSRWVIGKNNRQRGSIHSDLWTGSAAALSACKWLAIYPTVGWWHKRYYLGKSSQTMRYAVVVSLVTPSTQVNLYHSIKNIIDVKTSIPIEIRTTLV